MSENEKDVEYLEEKFPKGKTKFRREAMVLLSLARIQGEETRNTEVQKVIESIFEDNLDVYEFKTKLLQKLGLEK